MRFPRPWVAVLISFLVAAHPLGGASGKSRTFTVAAGAAEKTLREFSRQSGESLMYPLSLVRGVRTNAISGERSPDAALALMLEGTGLDAVRDEKTGALVLQRKAAPRKVPVDPAPPDVAAAGPRAEPPITLERYRLQERRDSGLITQTLLGTDAKAPLYHDVTTRREIEQLGVTSVAELLALLPGYSGDGIENVQTAIDTALDSGGSPNTSGAFLKMRGFDSMRTAVLLNGRRLPGALDARGPDLTRVPLSAVERIEVLPYSGSALYGQNVIGGAVNIVLRKDYVGHTLTVQAGTSTQGGGTEWSATLVEGFASEDGKTRATLILDAATREAVVMGDRKFVERALERQPLTAALELVRNRPAGVEASRTLFSYVLTLMPNTPAIVTRSGPGVSWDGQLFALEPGHDGTGLTPAEVRPLDLRGAGRSRHLRSVLRRPSDVLGATAQIEHAFVPERLELYSELSFSRAVDSFSAPRAVQPLRLSFFDALNPYSGTAEYRDVTVYFDPVDLPDNTYRQVRDSLRTVIGLRGDLPGGWRWTLDGAFDRLSTEVRLDSPNVPLNELVLRSRYSLTTQEFAALYNPLADHERFPISAETLSRAFTYRGFSDTVIELRGVAGRVFGDVGRLPGGAVRVSFRGEFEDERRRTTTWTEFSPLVFELSRRLPEITERTARKEAVDNRDNVSGTLEAVLPLIGARWRPFPIHEAELQVASRTSKSSDERNTSNTVAMRIALTPELVLRGSVSQGYLPPPANLVSAPVTQRSAPGAVNDPQLGGLLRANYFIREGGNPSLRAETSVSRAAGLVFEPPGLRGVSATVDVWEIEVKNGIRILTAQETVNHADELPGAVERYSDELQPDPQVIRGQVKTVDLRAINTADTASAGVDIAVSAQLPETRLGVFTLSAKGTHVWRYAEQLFRGEPAKDQLGLVAGDNRNWGAAAPLLRLRGRAGIGWRRERWSGSLTANYVSSYTARTLFQASSTDDMTWAEQIDSSEVGSSTVWDMQLTYDAMRPLGSLGGNVLFRNTRWTLGVRNLFDRMPPYRGDGLAFYSRFDDPRMRFVYLRVERAF